MIKNKTNLPATFGGSSFENTTLSFKGDLAYTSKTQTEALLLCAVGSVGFIGFLYLVYLGSYFGGLFIGILLISSAFFMSHYKQYIEIDRASLEIRIFKNKKNKAPLHRHPFNSISHIETITKFVSGRASAHGYYSTELNLVLKSGAQITVLNHAKSNKIKQSEESLKKFLIVCSDIR